jgi:polysaccharide chain length determinant protein (PEP-CTERM system associated)
LLRYTEKHPDVLAQRETLQQLKDRRAAEVEALRRGDAEAVAMSGASANPVYQNIQLSLNQVDVEIASLRRQIADHQSKVDELRKLVDTMPQVEAEFARLNRDYDVTRANYTALVEGLEKSQLGDQATTSGSVRFEIVEAPNTAFDPISPARPILIIAICALALALGVGVAFVLHELRPVFTSARRLAEATGLAVLGTVSLTSLDQRERELKRAYVGYAAAVFALFVAAVIAVQMSSMGMRLTLFAGGA